jgi:Cytosol aminopeptidase family, N-terminal domain
MELRFVAPDLRRLDEVSSEVIVCGLFADERPPHGTAGLIDWRLGGCICRLLREGFVTGAPGEVVMVAVRRKLPFDKALFFGLGDRAAFDPRRFRAAITQILGVLEGLCTRSAVVELPGRHTASIAADEAANMLLELSEERPDHDVWTLVEPPDEQRSIATKLIEQRRRDRRVVLADGK